MAKEKLATKPGSRRERRVLVAAAHAAIVRRSTTLAFATGLLDRKSREQLWLLYSWCRDCADLIGDRYPEQALDKIRMNTELAMAGGTVGEPSFDALGLVVRDTGLPQRYPRMVIDGLALDVADARPRNEGELYRYCHLTAGIPAAMAAIILGVAPNDGETLDRAANLGIACRLAAIARDISADAAEGRCYLPGDWLTEMDIPPGEHMKPPYRKRLAVMADRLAQRVDTFLASARHGVAALAFRPAWAALTLAAIHREIADEVVALGEHGWDHRVASNRADRIDKAMKAAFFALLRRHLPEGGETEPPWRNPQGWGEAHIGR